MRYAQPFGSRLDPGISIDDSRRMERHATALFLALLVASCGSTEEGQTRQTEEGQTRQEATASFERLVESLYPGNPGTRLDPGATVGTFTECVHTKMEIDGSGSKDDPFVGRLETETRLFGKDGEEAPVKANLKLVFLFRGGNWRCNTPSSLKVMDMSGEASSSHVAGFDPCDMVYRYCKGKQ